MVDFVASWICQGLHAPPPSMPIPTTPQTIRHGLAYCAGIQVMTPLCLQISAISEIPAFIRGFRVRFSCRPQKVHVSLRAPPSEVMWPSVYTVAASLTEVHKSTLYHTLWWILGAEERQRNRQCDCIIMVSAIAWEHCDWTEGEVISTKVLKAPPASIVLPNVYGFWERWISCWSSKNDLALWVDKSIHPWQVFHLNWALGGNWIDGNQYFLLWYTLYSRLKFPLEKYLMD